MYMTREKIFEDRREVARKICQDIRANNGLMINAKYFSERPYCDGVTPYKFSTANYLRLISSDNEIIQKGNPRWFSATEIKSNDWSLKENAMPVLLEVWTKDADQQCSLTEFYNASDILGKESFQLKNQSLEVVLKFFQERGLLEDNDEIISLQDAIDAVKKYAETYGANELTSILSAQTCFLECGLKTKIISFLPLYSETVLAEIEKSSDILFEAMSKAHSILKNLRREKIMSATGNITSEEIFHDLKVVYHGSEGELQNKNGFAYPKESILTGISAYDFLLALKSAREQKIWLEFSYKDYSHGKFLISGEDFAFEEEKFLTPFLRTRLDKNRQYLLDNPHELKKYLLSEKAMSAEELLTRISLESKFFQGVMDKFQREEFSYLENALED